MTSLRRRIFAGSVLWTTGMILLSAAAFSVFVEHFPRATLIGWVHGTLQGPLSLGLAVLCLVWGALLVRRGLLRVDALRRQLAALKEGDDRRLDGVYPSEIQPLVDDLNSLLESRERTIRRAVARAGDLAHGLKTPLAVLAQDVERARSAGHDDLAASIGQQVTRMQRQVDYHLAQARAAASGAGGRTRIPVAESVEGLVRVMRRVFADRPIEIDVRIPAAVVVRAEREDLDEMLGNLIENACKWTRSLVVVSAAVEDGHVRVTVDDDGGGIAPGLRAAVLQRGVRADEAAPGTGLGLAIVRDLAELYGGDITLTDSPAGGLRAVLRLPA